MLSVLITGASRGIGRAIGTPCPKIPTPEFSKTAGRAPE